MELEKTKHGTCKSFHYGETNTGYFKHDIGALSEAERVEFIRVCDAITAMQYDDNDCAIYSKFMASNRIETTQVK